MTESEPSVAAAKRCVFCGSDLPEGAPAPTRKRWLIASLSILGVGAVLLVVGACGYGPPWLAPTANGIVIATAALNGVFASYGRPS